MTLQAGAACMASAYGWVNLSNPAGRGPRLYLQGTQTLSLMGLCPHQPHRRSGSVLYRPASWQGDHLTGTSTQASWRDEDDLWHAVCVHIVCRRPSILFFLTSISQDATPIPGEPERDRLGSNKTRTIKVWQSTNGDGPGAPVLPALHTCWKDKIRNIAFISYRF